ncbi:MAG: glycoside hydrolase family 16 protein, partial [Acidimicrobiales bacterium]
ISVAIGPQANATASTPVAPPSVLSPPEGSIPDLAALGWQAVFDEQFNGSAVDESVWNILEEHGFAPDGINTRDTVSVTGGNLRMTNYTDASGLAHASKLFTGGIGTLNPTPGGFDSAYGYVEARMQFPDGPGTNSAFWMMSNNGNNSMPFGDPASDGPELDIVEHLNRPASGPDSGDADGDGFCDWPGGSTVACKETFLAGGHWDGFEEDHKVMHHEPVQNPNPAVSLQGNFHTYGMLWTPEEYRFFADGIEVKRVTAGLAFVPQHVILTTVTDPTPPDYGALGSPANDVTLVDYVKVWQRPIADVPHQATAVTTPLSVPFTVQDYFYGSASKAEPGPVTVTATSSNTTLVPNSSNNLAVSGNGPGDPDGAGPLEATDGSFTNGGFESGTSGWSVTPGTGTWGTKVHTGAQSLRLTQTGNRATQTITNLRPNTTYLVGAHYDTDLGYTDTNGNGRVDPGEAFTEPGDGTARFDLGIEDVDSARAGPQAVKTGYTRNGWDEQLKPAWWLRTAWPHDFVKFTTGPTTTAVTLFFDNTSYVGGQDDSDVSIDSVYVRPVVSPQRTLAIRPADGQAGDSTITLTAKDAAGTTIGTDNFVLTVGAGTLRDGSFEAGPATTAWTMTPTSTVIVPAPFQVDHQLELAKTANDTISQKVTGLASGARYKLEVTGRVSQVGGDVAAVVQNHGGAQVSTTITSTASTSQSVEFVTGATDTSADILLLDWNVPDGASTIEMVSLRKCTTVTSCAALVTSHPWNQPTDLASVGPQYGVSGVPLTIGARLPAGSTLSSVTSTNQVLVPNVDIATTGAGRHKAFSVTPVPDRTGRTNIRVAYTGAAGSPVDIPVTVSDAALRQPGFEKGGNGWALAGSAAATTASPRSGAQSMQVNGAGDVRQKVVGLPHATGYVLGAWVDGTATVTARTVPVEAGEEAEVLATASWTGSGWSEQKLPVTTLRCSDCKPELWRPVEIVISDTNTGDGLPMKIDDVYLVHSPVIRRTRDISLNSTQTTFGWPTRRASAFGRVAEHAIWDPAVVSVTTSDITNFGTGVVPVGNLEGPKLPDSGWPFSWWIDARAGAKTGRSNVNVTLTDPGTGHQTTDTYAVTVNAGNNFDNGDFERSALGATNKGWAGAWFNDSHEITRRQGWQYLGVHKAGSPYAGPRDDDKVARISSGAMKHVITGLTPSTEYRVRLKAKGDGSTVQVRTHDHIIEAPVMGSVAITPPNTENVWRDYTFTFTTLASGNGSTSVVLYLVDDLGGGAIAPSARPCSIYAAGESCFDDIGIFRLSDVG